MKTPVTPVALTATNTTTGAHLAPVQTGNSGTYKITAPAGSYSVKCEATGYVTATQAATVVAGKTTTLNFVLTSATVGSRLTGKVANASTGAAIVGAAVTAGSYSATTDSTGAYAISGMTAGTYTVNCSATGFTPPAGTVSLADGATVTKDFALSPVVTGGGILTGKISNASTGIIAGATITAGSYSTTSDNLGKYTIPI